MDEETVVTEKWHEFQEHLDEFNELVQEKEDPGDENELSQIRAELTEKLQKINKLLAEIA